MMASAPAGDPSPEDQAQLARRIALGDAAAEAELVALFERRVLAMVLSRMRDREVARDLVQDTLLAVLSALREGRLRDADRLGAFVYGTARNIVNNFFRCRGQEPAVCELLPESASVAPSGELEQDERLGLLRGGLDKLDASDRAILQMTLVEGLEPKAIAECLGLSREVVRARKSRALKKVAEYVKRRSQLGSAPHSYLVKVRR
jgi:RNA polymerase sigma-70 factor (ECF subfamily)